MLHAVVRNFRGCKEADLQISRIALIAGKNGAAKTSIARAIAAAATGKGVPFDKLPKKDSAIMLYHGTHSAMATLGNDDGSSSVEWAKEKAEVTSEGRPPFASPIAAGLDSILTMEKKDALTYMINLLGANVSKDDFIAALTEKGIDADTINRVWQTIEAQGWEAAHVRAKETATKLKGAWENITGEKFGSKKVAEWLPQDWEDSLAQYSDELPVLEEAGKKKFELENLLKRSAVSENEVSKLTTQAGLLETLKKQREDHLLSISAIETELKGIEEELRQNPNPNAKVEYDCPHCAHKIHIKAVSGSEYMLSKAEAIDPKKLEEARTTNASLCGKQQNAASRLRDAKARLQTLDFGIEEANKAGTKLKEIQEKQVQAATDEEITAVRKDIADMEKKASIIKKYREAKKSADQIGVNQVLIELLSETGLRRVRLDECLTEFREKFTNPLCEALGVKPFLMDSDLNIQVGKTPFKMLSASEQYRVCTVLQVGIATKENASIVIIDGADILDQGGRSGLLKMIHGSSVPAALICMTLPSPDKAPNLAQMGVGKSYWVENGVCESFKEAIKEAA